MKKEKSDKARLDKLLVDKGLCQTRSQAQGLILARHVTVNNNIIDKPGTLIAIDAILVVKAKPKYVSRGGFKLEQALTEFKIDVQGHICMDVGASSGGFTDCLLQHGAAHVYAIDVGYGQLDWSLRQDARVTVLEKTHIGRLNPESLDPKPSTAVIDVSFISLKKVLPSVVSFLPSLLRGGQGWVSPPTSLEPRYPNFSPEREGATQIIALVKPQFEYKDYCAVKGFRGVVTQAADHQTILLGLAQDLLQSLPMLQLCGVTASPIYGPKGNREFLFYFQSHASHLSNDLDDIFKNSIIQLTQASAS